MKVLISGCGKIGTAIIESLIKENHQIAVIDVDRQVIEKITSRYDVLGFCGNGAQYDLLVEAGVNKTDLFISVTGSDEFNMLSCFVAKKAGAKYTVARVRNSEYNNDSFEFVKSQLGLNMTINPELLTAQTLYNILELPSATNIEPFSASETEMIEVTVKAGSKMIGVPLFELRKKYNYAFLVCIVERKGEVYIPNGNFVLEEGDNIGVFASKSHTSKILQSLGFENKPIKSVIIVGAGKTTYYLSRLLTQSKTDVKVIEINKEKCKDFSKSLDKVSVINGDGMSQTLLLEEGISKTDGFVALTGKDEQNVLMSVFSQSKGVKKTIAKINRDEILGISKSIGLETVISPKYLMADVIVSYARALDNSKESKIETLYSLLGGKAEACEFIVLEDFKHLNTPLKQLKLKKNVLIAGIIRDRKIIIPGGEDVIKVNDRVIVITSGLPLYDLSDLIN